MSRWRSVFAGLVIGAVLLAGIVWASPSSIGLNRYSIGEALSRLASGYPFRDSKWEQPLKVGQDSVATDTLGIWCKTRGAKGGFRKGALWRFNSFHVAQWRWTWRSTGTADAPCTLFVWAGGVAGRVDSAKIYACSDTMIVPAPGAVHVATQTQVENAWTSHNIDSVIAAPVGTDSIFYFAIHAIGD